MQLTFAAGLITTSCVLMPSHRTQSQHTIVTDEFRCVGEDGTVVRGGDVITPNADNPIRRFAGGFHLFNAGAQFAWDTGHARWPFTMMVDFAHNFQSKFGDDNAYIIGAGLGQTRNPGDWAFSAAWTRVETDAVLSMFTLSDYGRRGGTNVQGPIAKIDYMLLPRLTLTAKGYFVNFIDRPNGVKRFNRQPRTTRCPVRVLISITDREPGTVYDLVWVVGALACFGIGNRQTPAYECETLAPVR